MAANIPKLRLLVGGAVIEGSQVTLEDLPRAEQGGPQVACTARPRGRRLKLYRLVQPRHSQIAFSGEGAFLTGGRWNSPGVRVVYTSSSLALAVLEVLAYRKARKPLSPRHRYTVQLEAAQVRRLSVPELPEGWQSYPYPESTQVLGDAWARAGETLALAVPSVLAPPEENVMLNCAHPDLHRLDIRGLELFPISLRLTPDAGEGNAGG